MSSGRQPGQGELFGKPEIPEHDPLPAQRHSRTSRKAADSIPLTLAERQRCLVLKEIRRRGHDGATDIEIQEALDLDGSSERPRRVELVKNRLVRDSGKTRLTRSGRPATVWVATTFLPRYHEQ